MTARLDRNLGHSGQLAEMHQVPDDEYFRMARKRAVVFDLHATRAIEFGAGRVGEDPPERRGLDPGGPDLRRRLDPAQRGIGGVGLQPVLVDVGHRGAEVDLDPDVFQILHRAPLQRLGKRAQDGGRGIEQHDPRLGRIDAPEIVSQCMARQLHELPSDLHARRPRPTTANVRKRRREAGSGSRSAISNAPRIRPRNSSASSIVFIPGASSANSGCPKYD